MGQINSHTYSTTKIQLPPDLNFTLSKKLAKSKKYDSGLHKLKKSVQGSINENVLGKAKDTKWRKDFDFLSNFMELESCDEKTGKRKTDIVINEDVNRATNSVNRTRSTVNINNLNVQALPKKFVRQAYRPKTAIYCLNLLTLNKNTKVFLIDSLRSNQYDLICSLNSQETGFIPKNLLRFPDLINAPFENLPYFMGSMTRIEVEKLMEINRTAHKKQAKEILKQENWKLAENGLFTIIYDKDGKMVLYYVYNNQLMTIEIFSEEANRNDEKQDSKNSRRMTIGDSIPMKYWLFGHQHLKFDSIEDLIDFYSSENCPLLCKEKFCKIAKNTLFTGFMGVWEIRPKQIKDKIKIGQGNFGVVYKAKYKYNPENTIESTNTSTSEIDVALKTLIIKDSASNSKFAKNPIFLQRIRKNFIDEVNVLKGLEHKHIVKLLGVLSDCDHPTMVMEFVNGGSIKSNFDVEKIINKIRKSSSNQELQEITENISFLSSYNTLSKMAYQVALGMLYLEQQNIRHRDLRTDNVLLKLGNNPKHKSEGKFENFSCQISDFGLSIMTDFLNQQNTGNQNVGNDPENKQLINQSQLPIRWMAPEIILSNSSVNKNVDFICDSKIDVWAFGVFIIELLTFCQMPYGPPIGPRGFSNTNTCSWICNERKTILDFENWNQSVIFDEEASEEKTVTNSSINSSATNSPIPEPITAEFEFLSNFLDQVFAFDPKERPDFKLLVRLMDHELKNGMRRNPRSLRSAV